jgi:hypothetical protein
LEWFEARSWKPTPKGLPSSLMQLRHNLGAPGDCDHRLRLIATSCSD